MPRIGTVVVVVVGVVLAGCAGSGGGNVGYSVGGANDANNFRENVREGYLPQETDLTYQGLFHDYSFDVRQRDPCRELFCPAYSRAVSKDPLSNETERFLTVGLESNVSRESFDRKKLNLVLVLDTSGSMDEGFDRYYYDSEGTRHETEQRRKIAAARQAVLSMLDQLRPGDRISVVTYSDGANTLVPMAAVGDRDMDRVRERVRGVSPDGGTNLEAGMERARSLVGEYADADPSEYENRVIYVTDAMPNLGDISDDGLKGALEADASRGIHSTFVGVGVDFNTRLVESISDVRGANYYSVHSAESFRERMDEGFDYMVTPLVFDLDVRLESEGYEISKVYGSPSADESTGRLLHVDTLFPSRTTNGSTEGGVVLLGLRKTGETDRIRLSATYEDRLGRERNVTRTVTFGDRPPEYFESRAVRKAVLLSRYGTLMRNWVGYERARASDRSPDPPGEGIDPHTERQLGEWEQRSVDLRVSGPYRDRIRQFRDHFRREAAAMGADGLTREVEVMNRILDAGDDDPVGEESGDPGSTDGSAALVDLRVRPAG